MDSFVSRSLQLMLLVASLLQPAAAALTFGPTSLILTRIHSTFNGISCPPSIDIGCTSAAGLVVEEYKLNAGGAGFGNASLMLSKKMLSVSQSASDAYIGALSLCADGSCAVFGANTATSQTTYTSTRPYIRGNRAIVRISHDTTIDTTTQISDTSLNGIIKGVCSFDGTGYFVVGNNSDNCVSYIAHGSMAGLVNASSSCDANGDGTQNGKYTGCVAAASPMALYFTRSITSLFQLQNQANFYGDALVDIALPPSTSWAQTNGMRLSGANVLDHRARGFDKPSYFSQILTNRARDGFWLLDPRECNIAMCYGNESIIFPVVLALTSASGDIGCSWLLQPQASLRKAFCPSGIALSLDENTIFIAARTRILSFPAWGNGVNEPAILFELSSPFSGEFRGISIPPYRCSATGATPVAGFYCPAGANSSIMVCPPGKFSAVGDTLACTTTAPSPSATPSPSVTATPSASVTPLACKIVSTHAGPDYITPNEPTGLAFDATGTILYVADNTMHEIVKILPNGKAENFVGSPGVRGYKNGIGCE